MSRSFGDYVASTVGVVADPEVTYFKVEFQWGFLVVASDGVWEFLSNERVCELLQSQPYEGMTVHSLESIANLIIKVINTHLR
jgi:serine/threonine protein phosphatase PrpC